MRALLRLLPLFTVLALAAEGFAQDDEAVEKSRLAKLEATYTSAKAAHSKKPKDAKLRKAFVDATVKLGTATMISVYLAPKDKYPRALRLYREALRIDPKNKEASENGKMIEDIYRSMGKEIPKD